MFIPDIWSEFFPSRILIFFLSRIPDPNFFHPGSEFFPSQNLSILTQKTVSKDICMIRVVHPGSGSWFFTHPRLPGSKRHRVSDPDPQHFNKGGRSVSDRNSFIQCGHGSGFTLFPLNAEMKLNNFKCEKNRSEIDFFIRLTGEASRRKGPTSTSRIGEGPGKNLRVIPLTWPP